MDRFVKRIKRSDVERNSGDTITIPSYEAPEEIKSNNVKKTTSSEIETGETIKISEIDFTSRDNLNKTTDNEHDGNNEQPSKAGSRIQNFRSAWQEQFSWLENKEGKACCKFCGKILSNNIVHLKRHDSSQFHQGIVQSLKNQVTIEEHSKKNGRQSKQTAVKVSELKIFMFLIEPNLSFLLISPLIKLIQAVATDSEIVKDIKCGKTKMTSVINSIVKQEHLDVVSSILKNQKFSLILDESTDISDCKSLAVVCRYFDFSVGRVKDCFLALLEMREFSAKYIYEEVVNFLNKNGIPINNMIGYAADNASVMMGNANGVKSYFQKTNPNLYVMNCICLSLHLCSSAAAKVFPNHIEKLTQNTYFFSSHSSKRQLEFKTFQEYFNVKAHKILKTSLTRCLALEQVINRILEQWVPLQHFFISHTFEGNSDLASDISSNLNVKNKVYFTFLSYVLKLVNEINTELQSESVRIHILMATVKGLTKTILSNFIKREFLDDLNRIDFHNQMYFLNIEVVYIGAKAELLIISNNFSKEDIIEIKTTCLKYYMELCSQIFKRINFNDKVLIAMQSIDPNNLGNSLVPLISLFPNLLPENEIQCLDNEYRTIINLTCVSKDLCLEEFWFKIFNLKNGLGEIMFPTLKKFLASILSFPHSSATCERIFSQLSLIKNEKRNCLKVCTVSSIMSAKELLNKKEASEWQPSQSLLRNYKK